MQIAESNIELNNVNSFEFIKTIPDNSVKLIVSDPPYGISFSGQTSNTNWDDIEDFETYIYNFLIEVKRILTEDGTLWMFCARTKIPEVFSAISKAGLYNNLENWMSYIRAKGRGADSKLKSQCEEILHITKTDKYHFDMIEYEREVVTPYVKDGLPRGWMLNIENGQRVRWSGLGNACCFTSPFQISKFEPQKKKKKKPVLLNAMLIMLSSKEGDTVYDFFSGSGSCGIASIITKRNFVGCELDKEMYEKSLNWLNNLDLDRAKEFVNKRIKYKKDPIDDSKYITDLNEIRKYESKKSPILKGGFFKDLGNKNGS